MAEKHQKLIFNIIKYGFIHAPAFFISVKLLVDMFVCLTNNPVEKPFYIFFAIVDDLSFQYFRAMARAYNRHRPKGYGIKLAGLWFLIGIYIIGNSFLSAVGVFAGGISEVETKQEISTFAQKENFAEYNRIKGELKTKTASRDDEEKRISKNGVSRGSEWKKLDAEVKYLESKLEASKLKVESSGKDTKTEKSPFLSLQDVFGIPANKFKQIMLFSALLIVFALLLITPWELPRSFVIHDDKIDDNTKENKPQVTFKEPLVEPLVTSNETIIEVDEPEKNTLEVVSNSKATEVLSIKKQKLIKLAECMYASGNLKKLNGLSVAYGELKKDPGVTWSECAGLIEELNRIGAINTSPGKSEAKWPLDKTVEYIKNMKTDGKEITDE